MQTTKTCTKCHETKPLDSFHNKERNKDGKNTQCKSCVLIDCKKYGEQHKERRRDANRAKVMAWREKNIDRYRAYQAEYKRKTRDKVRITMLTEKPCSKCHVVKSMDSFSPDGSYVHGRKSWCRECTNHERRKKVDQ